MINKAQILV